MDIFEEDLIHGKNYPNWEDYISEDTGEFDEAKYDSDVECWLNENKPATEKPPLHMVHEELINGVTFTEEEKQAYLEHYGTPRHSGRYPWGSGDTPYQHESYFMKDYNDLKAQGLSETEIAKGMGMTTTELRARKSYAFNEQRASTVRRVREMHDKGMSNVAIGKVIGKNESVVREYLKEGLQYRADLNITTANMLKEQIDQKKFIDIGSGSELYMGVNGITSTRLKTAVQILEDQGYTVYSDIKVPQATNPHQFTTVKVICPPGTTKKEAYEAATTLDENGNSNIKSVTSYSVDNGKSFLNLEKPVAFDSSRLEIRYGDQGGKDMDGVIQLRRGVEDISLGGSNYAQVRINVDDSHYLKGMAMYTDDLPDGVDIRFNTNKPSGTPIFRTPEMSKNQETVLKPMKTKVAEDGSKTIDWDNPFGSAIKEGEAGQRHYIDEKGNNKLSVINKVNSEGDWNDWSRTLSAQFLSKQSKGLIDKQLEATYAEKYEEFEKIKALTNPEVKKKLLESFADDCDSSAIHLKAVSLPRQSQKVILPLTSLKENEVYAPSYDDGETVVLVRYPHAGKFEIPKLIVNNKNAEGRNCMGTNPIDAIGIHPKAAARLSGADFDGDSVVVIPVNDKVKIQTQDPLPGLKDFDPSESYPYREGMKVMGKEEKQTQMGLVSNLITDMTIKGANQNELARAVRHSMVVIDAEKHKLDYIQSEIDNGIAELKTRYQGGPKAGASTLISRSKGKQVIPERKEGAKVVDPETGASKILKWDPETGEKYYTNTERTYKKYPKDENGNYDYTKEPKIKSATEDSTKMQYAFDTYGTAHAISSGHPIEEAYANYADKVHALANEARKLYSSTPDSKRDAAAAKKYSVEVAGMVHDLNEALKNTPRERQAQLIANAVYKAKLKANPDIKNDKAEQKKIRNMALKAARSRMGASRNLIEITPARWEAIQAHAISSTQLKQILMNCDQDKIREYATPRTTNSSVSAATERRIKALAASGHTTSEIAKAVGVSVSTVQSKLTHSESDLKGDEFI